ncbi:MAG: hypothetical protein MI862_25795 [Desulfobacterales bacterium]|nr:hypothetical protein [Desulfobacterales bacterium]
MNENFYDAGTFCDDDYSSFQYDQYDLNEFYSMIADSRQTPPVESRETPLK